MGCHPPLAERASLFYQPRLSRVDCPRVSAMWKWTGGGVVDRARLESVCT
jgi:hypothetical protein